MASNATATAMNDEATPVRSPWLDVPEAARILGVGNGMVYRLAASRRLRHARIGDRGLIRFKVEWLNAYVESCATEIPAR
jgi:excisionase family DNA binding protein